MIETLRKTFAAPAVKGARDRTFKFTLSTRDVDRMGDVVEQTGWKLDAYKKNPVVLFGHDYHGLPIGRTVAIAVEGGALRGTVEFPPPSVYAFADQVHDMIASGFLSTASVGFRPIRSTFNAQRGGTDFFEQELLEWSVVPVPALPEAVIESRSVDRERMDKWLRSGGVSLNPDSIAIVVGGASLTANEFREAFQAGLRDADRRLNKSADTVKFDRDDLRIALAAALDTLRPSIINELNRALGRSRGRLD